jgi:hypothetical protein
MKVQSFLISILKKWMVIFRKAYLTGQTTNGSKEMIDGPNCLHKSNVFV